MSKPVVASYELAKDLLCAALGGIVANPEYCENTPEETAVSSLILATHVLKMTVEKDILPLGSSLNESLLIDVQSEFVSKVTEAIKGDHNDLRKEAIILQAHRDAVNKLIKIEV